MTYVPIVIAFSSTWSKFIQVQLFSLFSNNKYPIKVYLLSENLSEYDLARFNNICDYFGNDYVCEYIDCSSIYSNYITSDINVDARFTKYTLLRLLIPYLIQDDKVLYLDGDTLVIDDIQDLCNMDLKNNMMAGCIDTGIAPEYKMSIGLDTKLPYVNAGVLLLNLRKMREEQLHDGCLDLINNRYLLGHDQCTLNLIANGSVEVIEPIYNACLSTQYDIPVDDVKIIHYAGVKPLDTWVKDLPYAVLWQEWESKFNECIP